MKTISVILLMIFSMICFGQFTPNNNQWEFFKKQKFDQNVQVGDGVGTDSLNVTGRVTTTIAIGAAYGGTGHGAYAVGDILYASGTTTLSKLNGVATGNALISGGVTTAPSWGKIALSTHISGTLPVLNGGTGQTTYTDGQLLIGNTTGNTLSKSTLTAGANITITNSSGSITIASTAVSGLSVVAASTSITGTAGNYYYYDVSADSDTLTLPASPTDDDRIGIYLQNTSGTNTLLIARGGNLIAGTTSNVLLYQEVDFLILQYFTGDWLIESNGIQLQGAKMYSTAGQTVNASTTTVIDFTTADGTDYGGLISVGDNAFIPRTAGRYDLGLRVAGAIAGVDKNFNAYVQVDGVDKCYTATVQTSTGITRTPHISSCVLDLVVGDTVKFAVYQDGTGSIVLATSALSRPAAVIKQVR